MRILPVNMEAAKESGNPFFIELYVIHLKTGDIRICNCDTVIHFAGYDYYPVPIERGSVKTSVDSKIDNMDLKISDADNSKVAALMEGFDFRGRTVELFRIQYPESLEDETLVLPVFIGYLDAPQYSNGEFTCSVICSFPKTKCPFRITQYFCNNTFGDDLCKMDKAVFTSTVDTNSSTPDNIKLMDVIGEADKYKMGLITIGYETRMIKSNSVDGYVTTYYPFQGDLTGTVTLTRNCDKTPESCRRYNNLQNYGGFLAIPKEFRVNT